MKFKHAPMVIRFMIATTFQFSGLIMFGQSPSDTVILRSDSENYLETSTLNFNSSLRDILRNDSGELQIELESIQLGYDNMPIKDPHIEIVGLPVLEIDSTINYYLKTVSPPAIKPKKVRE